MNIIVETAENFLPTGQVVVSNNDMRGLLIKADGSGGGHVRPSNTAFTPMYLNYASSYSEPPSPKFKNPIIEDLKALALRFAVVVPLAWCIAQILSFYGVMPTI